MMCSKASSAFRIPDFGAVEVWASFGDLGSSKLNAPLSLRQPPGLGGVESSGTRAGDCSEPASPGVPLWTAKSGHRLSLWTASVATIVYSSVYWLMGIVGLFINKIFESKISGGLQD
jgi:hypothetical protein